MSGKKKPNVLLIAIGVLGLGCVLCIGTTLTMDALGLIPTSTPTRPTTSTFTPEPSSTSTSTITVQPSKTPTATQTPEPIIAANENTFCVPSDSKREQGQVIEIVDGDTIKVRIDGKDYSVRYIGIDTPERGDPFSDQATDLNRQLVAGKTITLVKDVSETDRYDRLLRYVFVGDIFVNYELVRQGFAYAGTWPPDTACDATFKEAEQSAKSEKLAIWALPVVVAVPTSDVPTKSGGEVSSDDIVITTIFYNGSGQKEPDEYVEIRNNGPSSVNLKNWLLHDEGNKHSFTFPEHVMDPGAVCRIYTNENHGEYCGFNFGYSGSAIWNNSGDCAYLYDSSNKLVATSCY